MNVVLAFIYLAALANAPTPASHPPASAASAPAESSYRTEQFAALSETALVPENSGLAASRRHRDVFWTHNDSSPGPIRVWVFRLSPADRRKQLARHLGYIELAGIPNKDCEDIAMGPDNMIYLLDGGDNPPCKRTGKRIYRLAEPALDPDGPPVAITARCDAVRFDYPDPTDPHRPASRPDDRFDAECLLVHPVSGDMYVVTKRTHRNIPAARVYKLSATEVSWNADRVHVLDFVTDLSSAALNMVTAGDIDPAGTCLVLRNYWAAFEYDLPPHKTFDAIFAGKPRVIPLTQEMGRLLQGEGICYAADGRELVLTTEAPGERAGGDRRFRVFTIPGTQTRTQPAGAIR
jgi:hypothetical protein